MPNGEGSGVSQQEARNKWASKTDAEDWQEGINYAEENDNYRSGVASFLDINTDQVSNEVSTDWTDGVNSDRAANNYTANTGPEQANKWLQNYERAERERAGDNE